MPLLYQSSNLGKETGEGVAGWGRWWMFSINLHNFFGHEIMILIMLNIQSSSNLYSQIKLIFIHQNYALVTKQKGQIISLFF